MLRVLLAFVAAVGLLLQPVSAHSALESSIPAADSKVAEAKTLSLNFTQAVRLATVKLVGKDGDIALEVDRSAPAARSFSVPLPAITPGKYEVKWTATARDGHVMTGSFSFTVAPAVDGKSATPGKT